MYGNSQFDGNAAFSGGGFMPSQATQTADPAFSPAKNRDTQALLPLTVKQISEAFQASDDKANFLIDGVDVNNVKLVGMLYEKTERVTDVSFVLDDGTGRIDCHRWVNEAVDTKEMEILSNGMYVKVHGHLKGFQGKKQLMVYSVRPVTDYNEIANHFADCIYVHCHNTRLRKLQDAPHVLGYMPNTAVNTPSKGYQPTPSNHFSVQYNVDGVKGLDKIVLNYLQQPSCIAREKGVHRNELAQQLNIPEHKISEAIESLESEGLIYSTVDEFHYKSTANG
ncbi:Single-stranded DNA-binding replication protein A (RPA), medium (30 kD) subunit [Handroanthus impetiginosus]|uniref:Single-stranded DNA-binding replication protein A (RPA), medium (30 kD) subunit n=1 Tax=Handroanthus impetiginosus TaxID=429701 RepID=A0A2G9GMV6_9LAMI|nr:Single-stranded DNA-binding replication protein A (RPA), medium (30 kD) subunit [Handroanthus impetiginosus]